MTPSDLSQMSMEELFRLEVESTSQVLIDGLLALERDPAAVAPAEICMRAAHSLKGAARLVDVEAGVELAHAMEDFLVAVQEGHILLQQDHIDSLLRGVDLMKVITRNHDEVDATTRNQEAVAELKQDLSRIVAQPAFGVSAVPEAAQELSEGPFQRPDAQPPAPESAANTPSAAVGEPIRSASAPARPTQNDGSDRALRVTVDNLNRLLGLAGETLVESRRMKPFSESVLRLKRLHQEAAKAFEHLRESLPEAALDDRIQAALGDAQRRIVDCQQILSDRLLDLDTAEQRSTRLAHRLYDQALACRMRPLADGTAAYPRMVRDVARRLGRQVRLETSGGATLVDRDVLEKLDAPLGHLLRNAVDHGIELPDERIAAGKLPEGVITIEARHSAGSLQIVISDDGRGVDFGRLRQAVVDRKLASAENAAHLGEAELLEFLFLPGFSMKQEVTDISGRGVGLDVVQDMIRQVRGLVRVSSQPGSGTRFHLQLPLTLSVVRTLLVEIDEEPYAFPLASLVRAVIVPRDRISILEGREFFDFDGQQVGLVAASQILAIGRDKSTGQDLSVIVVGGHNNRYGIVVDRFMGGRELVLQPLDPRLGIIKDVSAAALMEDGSPVLVVDVDDMISSMEKLVSVDRLNSVQASAPAASIKPRKRVLVVDDSLTVRELERKLLDHHGFAADVAVDGVDGWEAARSGTYDLVVTDIDMPRMDGIELVKLIKRDPNLRSLPVMILSYKDREEDRRRGLEAGADYYLTKGSFHDDTLIGAVIDMIGKAAA